MKALTLPKCQVYIHEKPFVALIDTGATCCICSIQASKQLHMAKRVETNYCLKVANGSVLKVNKMIVADVTIGDGIKHGVEFLIADIQHDIILGSPLLGETHFSRSMGHVQIDANTAQIITAPLIQYGKRAACLVIEDLTLEPESVHTIYLANPLSTYYLTEKVICLENLEEGYLADNEVLITEGVQNNAEYVAIEIHNPWPYPLPVSAGTPVAAGYSMEETEQGLECNHLVEVKTENHQQRFEEHITLRKRKFNPDTSDAYKKVELGITLTGKQKSELVNLLSHKRWAFSCNDADLGMIKNYEFGISLKDESNGIYLKPRPTPPAYRQKAQICMDNWIETGVIEEASSPHNIPLFFIPKKGGAVRPVLDCRALNKETVPNRFPIPNLKSLLTEISEFIGTHGQKELFISSTDIQSAFNQLVVKEEDKSKCAFSWQSRQYQASRCLFGLRNSPSAFCQVMAEVTKPIPNCYVLLDDVLILTTSFSAHMDSLQMLFDRCIEFGITLKPGKTHLATESIEYLGFRLSKKGLEPLKSKVDPILEFPAPTSRKELRRFVGCTNFYSKFVKDGHRILSPLYKLCGRSSVPFQWKEEQQTAFEDYKKCLANYVMLTHRDLNKPLVLITDGSQDGIAGALHQVDNEGNFQPLGFVSRAITDSEKRLASRYIEFLAILYCLKEFEWEVIGNHVLVMTDHFSLTEVLHEKEYKIHQPVKILNAHVRLNRYDVSIMHKPNTFEGIIAIDAFSRAIPLKKPVESDDEDDNRIDRGVSEAIKTLPVVGKQPRLAPRRKQTGAVNTVNLRQFARDANDANDNVGLSTDNIGLQINQLKYSNQQIRSMQESDEHIKQKIRNRKCKLNNNGVYVQSGVEWPNPVLLVPNILARELVSFLHLSSGHLGAQRLALNIKRELHVYKLQEICSEVCQKCEDCIITKPKPSLKHPTRPSPDHGITPWSRFYTDLADFGRSDIYGNRYFLGIEDHTSRFLDGVCIPDKKNETIAIALANLILRHNAMNGKVIQDNGMEYNAEINRYLMTLFNISVSHVSPYYPQGNRIERRWREIGIQARLRQLDAETWSRDAMLLVYHTNNSPCSALGFLTPSEVLTGRPLHLPCFSPPDANERFNEFTWVGHLSRWMYQIGTELEHRQADRHECDREPDYRSKTLVVGTRVAYWSPQRPGTSKKLYRQFAGTATVSKILPNGAYEITDTNNRKFIRNIKFLRTLPPLFSPANEEN